MYGSVYKPTTQQLDTMVAFVKKHGENAIAIVIGNNRGSGSNMALRLKELGFISKI